MRKDNVQVLIYAKIVRGMKQLFPQLGRLRSSVQGILEHNLL